MTKEDSLDEKLRKISEETFGYGVGTNSDDIEGNDKAYMNLQNHAVKQSTKQIKQVFIDEGWVKVPSNRRSWFDEQMLKQIYPLMTGPEWYEKLNDEVNIMIDSWDPFDKTLGLSDYTKAAKRASGIKE